MIPPAFLGLTSDTRFSSSMTCFHPSTDFQHHLCSCRCNLPSVSSVLPAHTELKSAEPQHQNIAGFSLKLSASQPGERPPPRCQQSGQKANTRRAGASPRGPDWSPQPPRGTPPLRRGRYVSPTEMGWLYLSFLSLYSPPLAPSAFNQKEGMPTLILWNLAESRQTKENQNGCSWEKKWKKEPHTQPTSYIYVPKPYLLSLLYLFFFI